MYVNYIYEKNLSLKILVKYLGDRFFLYYLLLDFNHIANEISELRSPQLSLHD